MRSAPPTSVRASERFGEVGLWWGLASWERPECFPKSPCSRTSSWGHAYVDAGKFYGITMLYRRDPKPLGEDLPKIFSLLGEKED
jgi:hypothetical protein